MGSLLRSTVCHYCGGKAGTEDHIVPRSRLPKPMSQLPYWFRSNNVVAACFDCNGLKGADMSDCTCDACEWAWNVALKYYVAAEDRPRKVVPLVSGRSEEMSG